MQTLIKNTTAFGIFSADKRAGRLSHAYMLHFADKRNLRPALMLFAEEFFGGGENARKMAGLGDLTVYPAAGGKITVDGVTEIIADSALKPAGGGKKLYVICDFGSAGALVQNKLLKTLEEPPENVHFLLGTLSLAPVLPTVLSRVKTLTVPPFTEGEIFAALEREKHDPINAAAARDACGVLGAAQDMAEGGWFADIRRAAEEICAVRDYSAIGALSKKYGDTPYKEELLGEIRAVLFSALSAGGGCGLSPHTLVYALELVDGAFADLKFNAFFQGLLYDFMLKVATENKKWQKLRE